jgi:DNA polymerase kappa
LLAAGQVIFAIFRPELKDKPCAVGGKNSVLCTANYEARKYGLRAAMPTFIALELCPQVVLFEPDFTKYKHYANIFR